MSEPKRIDAGRPPVYGEILIRFDRATGAIGFQTSGFANGPEEMGVFEYVKGIRMEAMLKANPVNGKSVIVPPAGARVPQ